MRSTLWECDGPCKKRVEQASLPATWHEVTVDGITIGCVCGDCQNTQTIAALLVHFTTVRAAREAELQAQHPELRS